MSKEIIKTTDCKNTYLDDTLSTLQMAGHRIVSVFQENNDRYRIVYAVSDSGDWQKLEPGDRPPTGSILQVATLGGLMHLVAWGRTKLVGSQGDIVPLSEVFAYRVADEFPNEIWPEEGSR